MQMLASHRELKLVGVAGMPRRKLRRRRERSAKRGRRRFARSARSLQTNALAPSLTHRAAASLPSDQSAVGKLTHTYYCCATLHIESDALPCTPSLGPGQVEAPI